MNDDLIKSIIKVKLRLVHSAIDKLPQEIKDSAKRLEKITLEAINEAVDLKGDNIKNENGKDLKAIKID